MDHPRSLSRTWTPHRARTDPDTSTLAATPPWPRLATGRFTLPLSARVRPRRVGPAQLSNTWPAEPLFPFRSYSRGRAIRAGRSPSGRSQPEQEARSFSRVERPSSLMGQQQQMKPNLSLPSSFICFQFALPLLEIRIKFILAPKVMKSVS